MRTESLTFAALVLALALAAPLAAGDIHGRIVCKGVHDCGSAVVYVDRIAGKTFPAPSQHARIDQKNDLFVPRVLVIVPGTTVDFSNSDHLLHNVSTHDSCADKFDLGTWGFGESKSHTFKDECFVTLLCGRHAEMVAYVAVVPTPYATVARPDGTFRIPNVPDGAYTLKAWHPQLKPAATKVAVRGTADAHLELSR